MATTTPLGIVKIDGVTPTKMELLEAAARKEFGGTNLSATSGTIQEHGATAIYEYDGTDVLTVSIIKLPSFFGHRMMSVPEAQSKILAWVEGAINPPEPVPAKANELSKDVPPSVPVLDKTTPKDTSKATPNPNTGSAIPSVPSVPSDTKTDTPVVPSSVDTPVKAS